MRHRGRGTSRRRLIKRSLTGEQREIGRRRRGGRGGGGGGGGGGGDRTAIQWWQSVVVVCQCGCSLVAAADHDGEDGIVATGVCGGV
jgi:hypothetical protein